LKHYFSHPESNHAWLLSYGPNRRQYDGSDNPAAVAAWYALTDSSIRLTLA
jgi:hypothetical protein